MHNQKRYFLGGDIGGTKTHVFITDENGQGVGFGEAGPGNHETVGYEGLTASLAAAFQHAAGKEITSDQICGAGFGVAGYDWPSEEADTREAINVLRLPSQPAVVNDTILGLVAGSPQGWGVAVVAGTGCNCWGWNRTHTRLGRVTGGGFMMGENAGASELVYHAVRSVAFSWTRRGPQTLITDAFINLTGAKDLQDLLEGLMLGNYHLDGSAAPLIFKAAEAGDAVALDLIRWAGSELGELARAVIRQLEIENEEFDVVQVGSLYRGGKLLTDSMVESIHALSPGARVLRLQAPPVIGAVILGMEQAGLKVTPEMRANLAASFDSMLRKNHGDQE